MTVLLANAQAAPDRTWLWVVFAVAVVAALAIDLGLVNRKAHRPSLREAATWVCVWVTLALLFNVFVWHALDGRHALLFLICYLVELSLSVDNLFVFVVIFFHFAVSPAHQHRVLFWGILGAVVMRLVFIFAGVELVEQFQWLFYVFGAFLLYASLKLAFSKHEEFDPERTFVLRLARRLLPVTREDHGKHFFAREKVEVRNGAGTAVGSEERAPHGSPLAGGQGVALQDEKRHPPATRWAWKVTPLFLVLLVVEGTDVIFAVDSVPAVLGVLKDVQDPGAKRLLAYTSNIFAILGLRAMYFVLAGTLDKFHYLKYGLSFVLLFISLKLLLYQWMHLPPVVSLSIVVGLLAGSVLLSVLYPPKREPLPPEDPRDGGGDADEGS
jgi:tellurite resistance protein TerC